MKLAEALALRADLSARLAQLASRAEQNVLVQEGDEPAEDTRSLIAEHDRLSAELEELILRINQTNLTVPTRVTPTMTAALAKRDVLRGRVQLLRRVADQASQRTERGQRSELRWVSAVEVPAVRRDADRLSAELRDLDTAIQEANWSAELIEVGPGG
ncbi:DIP1984 family protein [Leucobacter sp. M11]|uniref:DIP1984 family protein n=1 Tax=Leucobacter sp. M11 TaxID=2993565 RepID=UPI002D7F3593|nr:DIP1984 family protein [Leucobacter sp. M11]MEB4616518.1 DIP1984 family protein [Leucobacter sp. M11]